MIKQRDYAGLMPNYQQLGAQQGQIWGGATQELFKALSQMLAQREADKYYGKFDVQSTTPQQNVTTDLLGRPITQTTSGYGGMPVTSQVPAGRRDVTTTQTVDYSQDPQRLIAGLMNANPEIARRAQAGIQGIQLQQPKLQNIPEGGAAVDYNRLSPTYGSAIAGRQKTSTPNLPEGFANLTPAKKAEVYNQTYGTNFTANDFEKQATDVPTQLARLQREYEELKKTDPTNTAKIRQYEAAIKKETEGLTRYQVRQTSKGLEVFDPVSGQTVNSIGGQSLPPAELKELADASTLFKRLEDITAKAPKLKDKFGAVEGRYNQIKVKFLNDGATQDVINELKSLITIAYTLSGKQISEREMEVLKDAMLPRLEQPYENFLSTLNFAKRYVANTHNSRVNYYKQNGYGVNVDMLPEGGKTIQTKSGNYTVEEIP